MNFNRSGKLSSPILQHWPEVLLAISALGFLYLWWYGQR